MTFIRSISNGWTHLANVMEAARLTAGQNSLSAGRIAAARTLVLDSPTASPSRVEHAGVASPVRRAA